VIRSAALTLVLALAAPGGADEIFKWTDENGRVHFSSQPPADGRESEKRTLPGGPAAGGWEGSIDGTRRSEQLGEATESAINSLQLELRRRKRARDDLQERYDAVAAELALALAQRTPPEGLPALRAREQGALRKLQTANAEIQGIELEIGRLRAIKAVGQVELEKPPTFGQ
jgi:hypothetical protein